MDWKNYIKDNKEPRIQTHTPFKGLKLLRTSPEANLALVGE